MPKFEGYSPLHISERVKRVGSLLTVLVEKKGSCPIYCSHAHLCGICFNITSIMITDCKICRRFSQPLRPQSMAYNFVDISNQQLEPIHKLIIAVRVGREILSVKKKCLREVNKDKLLVYTISNKVSKCNE